MKRFLSLVLSLVMVMSLVTVSAGAKDFTDNDAITYGEAVAVVSEVGIVDGYADGDFKPTNTLTRQAAAKIICNLILGPTTAAELHADTAPYPDVPTTSEFAGYIAFCQSRKIISGYGDGTFKPGNTLTGYAFMKMLLGALGYDATLEGYTGANWSINVAKQALHIGLDDNLETKEGAVFNGLKAVTREEACLYAFNTLQADLVEYNQRVTTNVNGTEITLSSGGAESRKWTSQKSRNDNILRDDIIQFAEEYFNKLVRRDDYTMFMEPANLWLYDKVEIGTFERLDLLVETYTGEVTGRDMYDRLKAGVIADNDLEVYVDGVDALGDGTVTFGSLTGTYNKFDKADLVRSNTKALGATANGVLTKVYVDTDRDVITVASRHTWLAKATADYSESREYAPLAAYYNDANNTHTYNVDVEDVPAVADVTKDTFYQVNVSWKNTGAGGTGEVVIINDVEILEDSTVTKFSAGSGDGSTKVSKLTTGGTEYKANVKAYYDKDVLDTYNDKLLTDSSYNVFLDSLGYFIGVELFEGTKNYVFVTGFDRNSSNLSVKTATACGIFLDGTMKNFQVNVTDTDKNIDKATGHNAAHFIKWSTTGYDQIGSDWDLAGKYGEGGIYDLNQWYTYIEAEDGTYTLKPCVRMTATRYLPAADKPVSGWGTDKISDTIRTDALSVVDDLTANNRVYGEDETVFLTVDLDVVDTTASAPKAITEVTGVYTGVQNVDIDVDVADAYAIRERQVFTVYDSDWYVIAAVVIGEARGATANYAYITSNAKSEELRDGTYYWEFDAVVNGEHQTLTAKSKYHNTIEALNPNTVQELRFDGDYVVAIKPVAETKFYNDYTKQIKDAQEIYRLRDELTVNVVDPDPANDTVPASINDDPDELTLQGHTLYVTKGRADVGLALASDCKAVTIQKENGSNKKTNFADVASAIDHLADEDPNKPGVQYDGKIYAVLNSNKTAKWVVFINDIELITGSGSGSGSGGGFSSGKYFKANTTIYPTGYARMVLDVTRPEFIDPDDGVGTDALDYQFDVFVNGRAYTHVSAAGTVVADGSTTGTYVWDNNTMFGYAPINEGDVVTVENFTFDFSDQTYLVKYYDQDNNELADSFFQTAPIRKVENTGTVITFQPKTADYVGGSTYSWSIAAGQLVKTGGTEPDLSGATVAIGTGATTTNAAKAAAGLTDYIKVVINTSGLTKAAPTYSLVKSASLSTDKAAAIGDTGTAATDTAINLINTSLTTVDDTIAIDASTAATGLADSTLITYTATLKKATNWDANEYEVKLVTDKGTLTFDLVANAGGTVTGTKTIRIAGSDITITDLTVTVKTKLLDVTSVTKVNDYTIEVKFNQGVNMTNSTTPVDLSVVAAKDNAGAAITGAVLTTTAGSDTVTIELPRALANGDNVDMTVGVLAHIFTDNTLTAQKWTYNSATGLFDKNP